MSETRELLWKLDVLSRSAKGGAKDALRVGNDEMAAWHLQREAETIDAAKAEITKLKSQLEEARADRDAYKRDAARALEQLGKGLDDQVDAVIEEARAKAIEEAACTAELHSRIDVRCRCGFEIAEDIRALLAAPTEARSVLEASHKGGE